MLHILTVSSSDIASVISTLGFPIVAFLLMYQMCNTTIKQVSDSIQELKEVIIELKGVVSE